MTRPETHYLDGSHQEESAPVWYDDRIWEPLGGALLLLVSAYFFLRGYPGLRMIFTDWGVSFIVGFSLGVLGVEFILDSGYDLEIGKLKRRHYPLIWGISLSLLLLFPILLVLGHALAERQFPEFYVIPILGQVLAILIVLTTALWWRDAMLNEKTTGVRVGFLLFGFVWSLAAFGAIAFVAYAIYFGDSLIDRWSPRFLSLTPFWAAVGPRIFYAGLPKPEKIGKISRLHKISLGAMLLFASAEMVETIRLLAGTLTSGGPPAYIRLAIRLAAWVVVIVWVRRLWNAAKIEVENWGHD